MLKTHRRRTQDDVQRRIRDGIAAGPAEVHDEIDRSGAWLQGDPDLALLQMRTEALGQVDQALVRLAAGTYGAGVECADDIPEPRLRALPLAVRCQACEQKREDAQRLERRGGGPSFQTIGLYGPARPGVPFGTARIGPAQIRCWSVSDRDRFRKLALQIERDRLTHKRLRALLSGVDAAIIERRRELRRLTTRIAKDDRH